MTTAINTIDPKVLKLQIDQDAPVAIIDVRTPVEFRAEHVRESVNIPLDAITREAVENASMEGTVYLLCRTGRRAGIACERLKRDGLEDVVVVDGGIEDCIDAGLTSVKGQKAISLERQVRIVAGSLCALGGLAALLVHPYFAALPAFVGSGLVFAGVTDTCAMGMLLAKMPWNQVRESTA